MNIAQKTIAIVAIAMVATIAVSTYFVFSLGNLQALNNTEIELLEHSGNIRGIRSEQSAVVAQHLLEPTDDHVAQYGELEEALHEELEEAEGKLSAVDFAPFEELHHEIDELAEIEEQLFALIAAGNMVEARELALLREGQAFAEGEYGHELEEFNEATAEFIADQQGRLDAAVAAQSASVNRGRIIGVALSVIALVVMGGAGWQFSRSVSGRINRLTVVADRLSQGEVDGLEVNVTGGDEIGRLGESLQGVLAAFELMRDEAIENEAKAAGEAA